MNLLVLDTSTERAALGVATASGGLYRATTEASRRHGRDLIPRLGLLLREAGLVAGDLDVLAVGLGPGSYTGLRVGLMAAKTLAYATGASLIGLDSLEAVARNAPPQARKVSAIADAQRGDVYVADFARAAPDAPLVETRGSRIEPLDGWLARLEADVMVLGPAMDSPRIRAALPADLIATEPTPHYPEASRLIELARDLCTRGRRDDPWLLEPRYLRRSAAEEQWDARGSLPDRGQDLPPVLQ